MEQKIVSLMLKSDFWNKYSSELDTDVFSDEIKPLVSTIQGVFSTHPDLKDLAMDELLAVHGKDHVMTTAGNKAFKRLVKDVYDSDDCNQELAGEILQSMRVKHLANQVAHNAIDIANGKHENFADISNMLTKGQELTGAEPLQATTTDVMELLAANDPTNRFAFKLQPLQDLTTGAGRGNLVILFGRPELGKSSLTAHCAVGYMEQGLRVDYYANEEPDWKIQLNMVRCATAASDDELRDGASLQQWDAIRDKIMLYDAVGITLEDLQTRVASSDADVIILDQADKFDVGGNFDSPTEKIKERYVRIREIAKRNAVLIICVSQASADAHDKRYPSYDTLENSKTGKAGEADIIIGIGHNSNIDGEDIRHLCISKNKVNGKHGNLTVMFDTARNQFSA